VILVNLPVLQKDRRPKRLNLTRKLSRFISEMMLKPFRKREMPVMSKFGKMIEDLKYRNINWLLKTGKLLEKSFLV